MRQTLIRLKLDGLVSIETLEGIPIIGVGWLLLPWTVWAAWRFVGASRDQRRGHVINFCLGVIVVLAVWLLSQGGQPGPHPPVFGYGLLVFIGCLLGGRTAVGRARRLGLPEQLIWDLAIWIFVAGLLGARTWYVVQYHERLFAGRLTLGSKIEAFLNISSGGLVLYGGVGLALIAVVVFTHRHREVCPPLQLADLVVPSFFLALACGRLGCLMNGCCWGDACELPWAIRFPHGSLPFRVMVGRGYLATDAESTFGVHPTQVYSALNALVLSLVTATMFRFSRRPGEVLAVALVTYPLTRLLLEVLRGDELGQFGTGLTISQCFSLLLLASGIIYTAWLVKSRPSPDDGGVAAP